MAMGAPRCPKCGAPVQSNSRYCMNCGEPVDAELVAELQRLYAELRQLDAWMRAGKGGYTVDALRTETAGRYLELRMAPARSSTSTVTAHPDTGEEPVLEPAAGAAAGAASVVVAASQPEAAVGAEPVPAGPVFSWRAFIAEQAIAIMAYLGGFLLLVATLTFEVGGWQVLDNVVKLAAVVAVYVIFAALGVALPHAASLRTVGRAYLGVFALMTPLVALAVYRFELQQQGFSPYGMLCLAAAYAGVVYLALAWRTRFATYAYLGWAGLLLAALAIVPWVRADRSWWLPALAVASLGLLAPYRLRHVGPNAAVASVALPAAQLAALTSLAAAAAIETAGLLPVVGGDPRWAMLSPAVLATATVALVPLAALWSATLRDRRTEAVQGVEDAYPSASDAANAGTSAAQGGVGALAGQEYEATAIDTTDWLVAAFAAQAAVAVAWWLGADVRGLSLVLAGSALGELALAAVLRRVQPTRRALRYGVEGIALALVGIAPPLVWAMPASEGYQLASLVAGLVVTASLAGMESARWWLLASGLYLTLAYRTLLRVVLPTDVITSASWPYDNLRVLSVCVAALALAVWAAALLLGLRSASRRFALPVYVVALGEALYATAMLVGQPAAQQTIILALFALASLAAGRRERRPVAANLLFAFFGGLAVVPYAAFDERGAHVALAALVAALVALGVRRGLGRTWAYGAYGVGLWAALLAFWRLEQPEVSPVFASWLGISFACWLLLVVAALAAVAAYWEGTRWALAAPAGLALLATAYAPDMKSQVALVLALAGLGACWRQYRGAWEGAAWHAAALLASGAVAYRMLALEPSLPNWALAVPLAFGIAAYLVSAHERESLVTPVATVYLIAAFWRIPSSHPLVPTLVMTFALVGVGVALRLRWGVRWALAVYGAAAAGSIFAAARVSPPNAGLVEALLLIFAALAYALVALERQPLAGIVPALYACAAAVMQPDAHALLPLALALGVLALAVGRSAGPRWSWPLYAGAAANAAASAFLAQGDPRFEALSLLVIALLAYLAAALESRPDLLPLAFLLGGLALASATSALAWVEWQRIVAFTALGWVYFAGAALWLRVPWLRQRGGAWWVDLGGEMDVSLPVGDPRALGAQVHWWSGLTVAAGVCVAAMIAAPDTFAVHTGPTEAVVVALLSLGGMLAVQARRPGMHALWYVAGELLTLAITWQVRWLGVDNIQAFVLAPGSYQLIIGALLPADKRLHRPMRLGQVCSLAGSLLLLLPTLAQSFQGAEEWAYALLLAVEALAIAGAGVGTRSRLLVLTGSLFVGVAALRGAAMAVTSGVPVTIVIAALALLLMGGATWLSLRSRRGTGLTS